MESPLIIRADGGAEIGTGHIMRCIALAQQWKQSGGSAVFVTESQSPALQARLLQNGFTVRTISEPGSAADMQMLLQSAKELRARWVVVDGYAFDAEYQRAIKDAGLKLLVVDDYAHAQRYHADLVLNQNLTATEQLYGERENSTRLLLGPKFALLRREFLRWKQKGKLIGDSPTNLLVTFGGGDSGTAGLCLLGAIRQIELKELNIRIVSGPANPRLQDLRSELEKCPKNFELMIAVEDMSELMAWADLALSAAGSTCWELAYMGLPAILVAVAENQLGNAGLLDALGIARFLGWAGKASETDLVSELKHLLESTEKRRQMSERGRKLVDGLGAFRVWMEMNADVISFRDVQAEDGRLLLEWANDPQVRAASFSREAIPWDDHRRWLSAKLADQSCRFWIGCDEAGRAFGQIRFDLNGKSAVVSVTVSSECRGRNRGSLLIALAARKLLAETAVESITAHIKPENEGSRRAFEKAGFARRASTTVKGQAALEFELSRN